MSTSFFKHFYTAEELAKMSPEERSRTEDAILHEVDVYWKELLRKEQQTVPTTVCIEIATQFLSFASADEKCFVEILEAYLKKVSDQATETVASN